MLPSSLYTRFTFVLSFIDIAEVNFCVFFRVTSVVVPFRRTGYVASLFVARDGWVYVVVVPNMPFLELVNPPILPQDSLPDTSNPVNPVLPSHLYSHSRLLRST